MQRSWGENELDVFQGQEEDQGRCNPVNSTESDALRVEREAGAGPLGHYVVGSTLDFIPNAMVSVYNILGKREI